MQGLAVNGRCGSRPGGAGCSTARRAARRSSHSGPGVRTEGAISASGSATPRETVSSDTLPYLLHRHAREPAGAFTSSARLSRGEHPPVRRLHFLLRLPSACC